MMRVVVRYFIITSLTILLRRLRNALLRSLHISSIDGL